MSTDPSLVTTRPRRRVLLSWSSGKDSAWTLHVLRGHEDLKVVGLLTTFNESADRVAMHAVRRSLVEAQARAADLPLIPVWLPWPCANEIYETRMRAALDTAVGTLGATVVAFGDLFLEDVRAYRERKLAESGLEPIFPLWGLPTDRLALDMIDAGLEAHLSCVDPRQVPAALAGKRYDRELLDGLPDHVDPCGERGEFHTIAHAGPMFSETIEVAPGAIVERDGFVFADFHAIACEIAGLVPSRHRQPSAACACR